MFLKLAYGVILHRTKVIFQNTDDLNLFLKNGWVKENQATIIPGSGVDTGRFTPAPKDDPGKIPLVILPARMLWAKGIGEFVEAAHLLRAKGPAIRMALVGDLYSGNPDAIPLESLNRWQQEGSVEWWGWREDMVDVYHQADLVCLPSYHEGLSKTLVEAAACGKAIITTDVPGCRDVVRHGENGLLVPPKNAAALAQAIETLITDPELCANMGARGRQIAEREFAAEKIVAQTLRVYEK
jgi:glycosyltransferase involved in cell wall biosynthesis